LSGIDVYPRRRAGGKEVTMSQIIVCRSQKGIVLGADAHTVEIDARGNLQDSQIQRLFQLNAHAVLMVGGGAAGATMGAALQSFMASEKLQTIEDVYAASLPFLATAYETYMQNHCRRVPVDPIHHIYFILAGHSPGHLESRFKPI
jgi:20S proteasome alpha/beta subunit